MHPLTYLVPTPSRISCGICRVFGPLFLRLHLSPCRRCIVSVGNKLAEEVAVPAIWGFVPQILLWQLYEFLYGILSFIYLRLTPECKARRV